LGEITLILDHVPAKIKKILLAKIFSLNFEVFLLNMGGCCKNGF